MSKTKIKQYQKKGSKKVKVVENKGKIRENLEEKNMKFWAKKIRQKITSSVVIFALLFPWIAQPAYAFLGFGQSSTDNVPNSENEKVVVLLVEESLLDNSTLKSKINRYAKDVQIAVQGQVVAVPVAKDASVYEIYEGLSHLYFSGINNDNKSQLVGVIGVGEIPLPVVEKNKVLLPTIFPYTDFEQTLYKWDKEKEQFVYDGEGEDAEIWHGLIRSDWESEDKKLIKTEREKELIKFFDKNHEVHLGNENFAKKVFYADLPRQKIGMPSQTLEFYKNWVEYAEHYFYLRFSKHWAKKMLDKFSAEMTKVSTYLPELGNMQELNFDGVPDIFSKIIIDNFLKRYLQGYENYLPTIYSRIDSAGRWTDKEIDTTIVLVSEKDEWAVSEIKKFNDDLENAFLKKIREKKIARDLSLPVERNVSFCLSDSEVIHYGGYTCSYSTTTPPSILGGASETSTTVLNSVCPYQENIESSGEDGASQCIKDNSYEEYSRNFATSNLDSQNIYVFGQKVRDKFSDYNSAAELCSIYRGQERNENKIFAQKIEGNKVYNLDTINEGGAGNCLVNSAGCCANNLKVNSNGGLSYLSCNPQNAITPIFDIVATAEIKSGTFGAGGCDDFYLEKTFHNDGFSELEISRIIAYLDSDNKIKTFSSLVVHDEPRQSTIDAQVKKQSTQSIPIDEDRGVSFYDKNYNLQKVNFINGFDLRAEAVDKTEENRKIFLQEKIREILTNKISELNNLSAGASLEVLDFNEIFTEERLKNLAEAIVWFDKSAENKNIEIFKGILSDNGEANRVLAKNDFNGYEVVQILGENKVIEEKEGVQLAFEWGNKEPSNVYTNAKNAGEFSSNTDGLGKNLANFFAKLTGNENSDENKNDNKDDGKVKCNRLIFTWGPTCLIPWAAELTNVVSGFVAVPTDKLQEDADDESDSNSDSEENDSENSKQTLVTQMVTEVDLKKNTSADIFYSPKKVVLGNSLSSIARVNVKSCSKVKVVSRDENFAKNFQAKLLTGTGDSVVSIQPNKFLTKDDKTSFYIKCDDKFTQPITVNISEQKIKFHPKTTKFIVAQNGKLQFSAFIEGKTDNELKLVEGKTVDIYFEDKPEPKFSFEIKSGQIKGEIPMPTKSGLKTLIVDATKIDLPAIQQLIELKPNDPQIIKLVGDQQKAQELVLNGDWRNFQFQPVDEFNNIVEDFDEEINFTVENAKHKLTNNLGNILIKKSQDKGKNLESKKAVINVDSPSLVKKSPSFFLNIIADPIISIKTTDVELVAGESQTQIVEIFAKKGQDFLTGKYNLVLTVDDESIIEAPKQVILKDGKGVFSIKPKTRAGNVNITISANGFISNTFSVNVKPNKPERLQIFTATESSISNISTLDSQAEYAKEIEVKVFDRYENLANFNDSLSLVYNPKNDPSLISSAEEYNVPPEWDEYLERGKELMQNQAKVDDDFVTGVDLIGKNNETLQFVNGISKAEIKPTGQSGTLYLLAKKEGLLPATAEIEITSTLKLSELVDLSPKSLVTFLLGFAGGSLNKMSFANRFLFSGNTQSVVTQVQSIEKKKWVGSIANNGELYGDFLPKLKNSNVFQFDMYNEAEDFLFTGKRHYKQNFGTNNVFYNAKKIDKEGTYISLVRDLSYDVSQFEFSKNTLYLDDSPLILFGSAGGVTVLDDSVELLSVDNSIFKWEVFYKEEIIAEILFKINNSKVVASFSSSFEDTSSEIILSKINSQFAVFDSFVGNSTNQEGLGLFYNNELENSSRTLGTSKSSVEDAFDDEELLWNSEWKPATLFAAGSNIGSAVKYGASDAVIILGDPTIAIREKNSRNSLGITEDIGQPIWQSKDGTIKQIEVGDVNGDKRSEILMHVNDKLLALYNDKRQYDNFRDIGPLLRFGDGARKIAIYEDKEGNLLDIIQINDKGELIFHENINGTFTRNSPGLKLGDREFGGVNVPMVDVVVANLNGDEFKDLVLQDEANSLYFAYGRSNDEFYNMQLLYSFAPIFNSLEETYKILDGKDIDDNSEKKAEFAKLAEFFAKYDGKENGVWDDQLIRISDENFVPFIKNTDFDVNFSMQNATGGGMKPGSKIDVNLEISPKKNLKNLEILFPQYAGLKFVDDSFQCGDISSQKCSFVSLESENKIAVDILEKNKKVIFSWKLEVIEVPKVDFFVEDTKGHDGIDEVVVPWQNGKEKEIIEFSSIGENKNYPQQKLIPAVSNSVDNKSDLAFYKRNARSLMANSFSSESTNSTNVYTGESSHALNRVDVNDNSDNSYSVPSYSGSSVSNSNIDANTAAQNYLNSANFYDVSMKSARKCPCNPIPSYALLAPGPQSLYLPPFSVSLPSLPGVPVFGFDPTFWAGIVPILIHPGFQRPMSIFRLYVMPTTNGAVGMAACVGPYVLAPPAPFPPQCFLAATMPPDLGICGLKLSTGLNFSGATSGGGSVNFTIDSVNSFNNALVSGGDVIAKWMQKQWRELANVKVPSVTVRLPKGSEKISSVAKNIKQTKKQIKEIDKEQKSLQKRFEGTVDTKMRIELDNEITNLDKKKRDLSYKLISDSGKEFSFISFENRKVLVKYPKITGEELDDLLLSLDDIRGLIAEKIREIQEIQKHLGDFVKTLAQKLQAMIEDNFNFLVDILDLEKLLNKILNSFLSDLEGLLVRFDSILSTLGDIFKGFGELLEMLRDLPEQLLDLIKVMYNFDNIFKNLFSNWVKDLKEFMKAWKDFMKQLDLIMDILQSLPDLFSALGAQSVGNTCTVNRGASLAWIMDLLLSGFDLPILEMPKLPDLVLDASKLDIGLKVQIPKFELQPVELDLPDLAKALDIDFDVMFEGILDCILAQLVELLKNFDLSQILNMTAAEFDKFIDDLLAQISLEGMGLLDALDALISGLEALTSLFPNLQELLAAFKQLFLIPLLLLPKLPSILPPPIFPDLLGPLMSLLALPKAMLGMLSFMFAGIMPVPEWMLGGQVQHLTNRTVLIDLDLSAKLNLSLGIISGAYGLKDIIGKSIANSFKNNQAESNDLVQVVSKYNSEKGEVSIFLIANKLDLLGEQVSFFDTLVEPINMQVDMLQDNLEKLTKMIEGIGAQFALGCVECSVMVLDSANEKPLQTQESVSQETKPESESVITNQTSEPSKNIIKTRDEITLELQEVGKISRNILPQQLPSNEALVDLYNNEKGQKVSLYDGIVDDVEDLPLATENFGKLFNADGAVYKSNGVEWIKQNADVNLLNDTEQDQNNLERTDYQNNSDTNVDQNNFNENTINSVENKERIFRDIPLTHEMDGILREAVKNDWLTGYGNNTARLEWETNRAEFANILIRAFKFQDVPPNDLSEFSDIDGDEWYLETLGQAVNIGIMHGYGDNTIRPARKISVAETAKMLALILKKKNNEINDFQKTNNDTWFHPYTKYIREKLEGKCIENFCNLDDIFQNENSEEKILRGNIILIVALLLEDFEDLSKVSREIITLSSKNEEEVENELKLQSNFESAIRILAQNKNINFKTEKDVSDFVQKNREKIVALSEDYNFSRTKNWTASTDFTQATQQSENVDLGDFSPSIFYYDSETNVSSSITKFPLAGKNYKYKIDDLDRDNEDEIIYSINDILFLKRRVLPAEYVANEDREYENKSVIWWDFDFFAKKFIAIKDIFNSTNIKGSEVSFYQYDDTTYFEWIISERPDHIFEMDLSRKNRISDSWKRIGFFINPKSKKYEIKPIKAQVTRVKGKPRVNAYAMNQIFAVGNKCDDDSVEKPFFASETVLIGVDNYSRMKVKVPPMEGQEEKMREIVLRKGEETVVDYAEVCLMRGKLAYAKDDDMGERILEKGDYFIPGMSLENSSSEEVDLQLANGVELTIEPNESYQLLGFENSEDVMTYFKELDFKNYYGSLIGYKVVDGKTVRSFSREKMIHDSQIADDKLAPEIITDAGNVVNAYLNSPIFINAENSFDDGFIDFVWWDLDLESDTDEDGEFKNDKDFPKKFDESYDYKKYLNVNLPPIKTIGKKQLALNIQDSSGKISRKIITINVKAPSLELHSVSSTFGQVSGVFALEKENQKINFLRERNGRESVLDEYALTDSSGVFTEKLSENSNEVIIRDKFTDKEIMKVFPNGRVLIENDKWHTTLVSASENNPMTLNILNENAELQMSLFYKIDSEGDIIIDTDKTGYISDDLLNLKEIHALDVNIDDNIVWKNFDINNVEWAGKLALVDQKNGKTLGVLDKDGNFYVTEGGVIYLQIRDGKAEEKLVFEIYQQDEIKVAEFILPIVETVWVK